LSFFQKEKDIQFLKPYKEDIVNLAFNLHPYTRPFPKLHTNMPENSNHKLTLCDENATKFSPLSSHVNIYLRDTRRKEKNLIIRGKKQYGELITKLTYKSTRVRSLNVYIHNIGKQDVNYFIFINGTSLLEYN